MSRTVPQRSYAAVSGASYDRCWTPWHGVAPLLPYLPPQARIWEPAAGEGWLARWLREAGHTVIESDIDRGLDFFSYEPEEAWDIIVTNVPFSLKYQFLRRAYSLGKPFAFLVPCNTPLIKSAKDIRDEFGVEFEELRLDKRINFYMPGSGFHNNGAQMLTNWLCWQLLPQPIIDAHVPDPLPEHRLIKPPKKRKPKLADALAWAEAEGAADPELTARLIFEAWSKGIPLNDPQQTAMFDEVPS